MTSWDGCKTLVFYRLIWFVTLNPCFVTWNGVIFIVSVVRPGLLIKRYGWSYWSYFGFNLVSFPLSGLCQVVSADFGVVSCSIFLLWSALGCISFWVSVCDALIENGYNWFHWLLLEYIGYYGNLRDLNVFFSLCPVDTTSFIGCIGVIWLLMVNVLFLCFTRNFNDCYNWFYRFIW